MCVGITGEDMMFGSLTEVEECWSLLHGELGPGYREFIGFLKCYYCSCMYKCESELGSVQ
jgi:hypothetical protein